MIERVEAQGGQEPIVNKVDIINTPCSSRDLLKEYMPLNG